MFNNLLSVRYDKFLCKILKGLTKLLQILLLNYSRDAFKSLGCLYPGNTVKTLNIGTPRPATVLVLNIKQFNFTMK